MSKGIACTTIGLAGALVLQDARAHHAMEYATPATALDGFISGLAHPVIGLDHLLFVLGVGAACYYFGRRPALAIPFLAAAIAGTLLHVREVALPYAEVWVAASLVVLALILLRAGTPRARPLAAVVMGLAGLLHGYAYGEAVIGAETTPLVAYLAGFTLVQILVAACGYTLARRLDRSAARTRALAAASGLLMAAGAGLIGVALIG